MVSAEARHPSVSVIVPAYNEEEGLARTLEVLLEVADKSYEIIVVDDGSTDRTATIAAHYPVRLISHERNLGKGRAVRSGLAAARGESIVLIDADNTYPAPLIPRFVEMLDASDMVIGVRDETHVPRLNRLGNRIFQRCLQVLYGSASDDPLSGFYAIRARRLREMKLTSRGFGIETEIAIKAARMGLRIRNVPIEYRSRTGTTKLNPIRDGYRILNTLTGFVALYNPTVTFLIPGLALAAGGTGLMSVLLVQPIRLGAIRLSSHSMLVLGSIAVVGFQLMVFGLVSKLYACTYWMATQDRLTRFLVRKRARVGAVLLGSVLLLVGLGWGLTLLQEWARLGFGDFTRTREAAFVSFALLSGVQILFSYVFVDLFIRSLGHERELVEESSRAVEAAEPQVVVASISQFMP